MATTINASTSSGLVSTADTSGVLQLQTANTTAVSISAAQVVNFTNAIGISGAPLGGSGGVFRNIEIGSSGTNTTTITGQTNSAAGGIVVGGYLTSANTLLYNVYSGQQVSRFNMNDGAFIFSNAPNGVAGTSITLTERMLLNSSGNLGLGVTPSAWSGFRALQIGGTTSLWSSTSGNSSSFYTNNGYFNGSNRIYLTSNVFLLHHLTSLFQ